MRPYPLAGSKSEDNPHVFRRFPALEIENTLILHRMSHCDVWGNVEQLRNFNQWRKSMVKMKKTFMGCALLLMALVGRAQAACMPISSAPYIVTQSGLYCLTNNVVVNNDNGIVIRTSHVDLDLQGHSITNAGAVTRGIAGVQFYTYETGTAGDITIHNGVVDGFTNGIIASNTTNNTAVAGITIDNMTIRNSKSRGLVVYASDITITNNRVYATRAANFVTGIELKSNLPVSSTASNRAVITGNQVIDTTVTQATDPYSNAVGLSVGYFADILIRGNLVINTWVPIINANESAIGIDVDATGGFCNNACTSVPTAGLVVEDNSLTIDAATSRKASKSTGIRIIRAGSHAIIRNSVILRHTTGIDASGFMWPNTPPVLMLDNGIYGAVTPIKGGVTLSK